MSVKGTHIEKNILTDVSFVDWDQFRNSTILITGATGLVGHTIIQLLDCAESNHRLNAKVISLVRDEKEARHRFSGIHNLKLHFLEQDIVDTILFDENVDYIIHAASITDSKSFVEKPVEVIRTAVYGTDNILRFASNKGVRSVVYISSMEVYGFPAKGHRVNESEIGTFMPAHIRNSYPISKTQCESLCYAYYVEYGVPVSVVRLAQVYGVNPQKKDQRLFAYIQKCIRDKRDIVLKTDGESERSFIHSSDAALALLVVLQKGKRGETYNVADDGLYGSVRTIAEFMANDNGIKVFYESRGKCDEYPQTNQIKLDTHKIRGLGWRPLIDIESSIANRLLCL